MKIIAFIIFFKSCSKSTFCVPCKNRNICTKKVTAENGCITFYKHFMIMNYSWISMFQENNLISTSIKMLLMLQQGCILEKSSLVTFSTFQSPLWTTFKAIRRGSIGSEGTSGKEKLQFADQFDPSDKFYRRMPNLLYSIYFCAIGIYFANVNVNIYLHNVNHSGLQMLLCNDFAICHARAEALANSKWNGCTSLSIF